jgi:ArsR family transcriptional regulator, arsenate/arsenite/antimonite-responsive transcriptional repressor
LRAWGCSIPPALLPRLFLGLDSFGPLLLYFHSSGIMNTSAAVDSLSALAQERRLNIFRLLVRHAPGGLPAGVIASRLRLPGPTLSFHLNALAAAALITPHKNGRSISYAANLETINRLTNFLMENCCGTRGVCFDIRDNFSDRRAHESGTDLTSAGIRPKGGHPR